MTAKNNITLPVVTDYWHIIVIIIVVFADIILLKIIDINGFNIVLSRYEHYTHHIWFTFVLVCINLYCHII